MKVVPLVDELPSAREIGLSAVSAVGEAIANGTLKKNTKFWQTEADMLAREGDKISANFEYMDLVMGLAWYGTLNLKLGYDQAFEFVRKANVILYSELTSSLSQRVASFKEALITAIFAKAKARRRGRPSGSLSNLLQDLEIHSDVLLRAINHAQAGQGFDLETARREVVREMVESGKLAVRGDQSSVQQSIETHLKRLKRNHSTILKLVLELDKKSDPSTN